MRVHFHLVLIHFLNYRFISSDAPASGELRGSSYAEVHWKRIFVIH